MTLWTAGTPTQAQAAASAPDPAAQFGAQESIQNPQLSPDGKHIVYIGPGAGGGTDNYVYVVDIAARTINGIVHADAKPMRLSSCGWSTSDRLVCNQYGQVRIERKVTNYSRLFAIDIDGKNALALGRPDSGEKLYGRQFDGRILDWLNGVDGNVMLVRYYVPDASTGLLTAQTAEGYGVDLVDTRTGKVARVEPPLDNVDYVSDGRGKVRIKTVEQTDSSRYLNGRLKYFYRAPEEREWRELGTYDEDAERFQALAVDSGLNAAYVLKDLDNRRALFRVALDGSLKTELVFAHPSVDITDVVTIGRNGRVIGAYYQTEKPHVEYFDPVYRQLERQLAGALPQLPIITFLSASADEKRLLILASSDTDPGRYFVLDRATSRFNEVLTARPELAHVKLAKVKSVTYPAADGTSVPAYLTLPPGREEATGLPSIVMPHGGPAARDVWGFDWWAQFYAQMGFAVLQPNYRGSAGYGNDWFEKNGFKSWKAALGDIIDGGRWMVKQGFADPGKLAIVGWSYGGYAALQANVVDPDLFKAVVAVAPVTDLDLLRLEYQGFTSERVARNFIGTGPHVVEGSPARHPEAFKAPVLMFHADMDGNVDIAESRAMDKALQKAGKKHELVVYPKLDHQLYDGMARTDMLRRSLSFLRTHLKLPTQ